MYENCWLVAKNKDAGNVVNLSDKCSFLDLPFTWAQVTDLILIYDAQICFRIYHRPLFFCLPSQFSLNALSLLCLSFINQVSVLVFYV